MITTKARRLVLWAAVLLAVPGILSIAFPALSGASRIELRELQNLPGFPRTLGDAYRWPGKFDAFTSDQFPFREGIVTASSRMFYQLGASISPEVVIGKEGWLFLKRTVNVLAKARGIRTWPDAQVRKWVATYIERRRILTEQNIRTLFVIVPNKHTIYPQYLRSCDFPVGPTITDQLMAEFRRENVQGVIDLRGVLQERSQQERLYDKVDTHWNDLGAYYGYLEVLRQIPDARRIPPEQIAWQHVRRQGDLSNLIGSPGLVRDTVVADITPPGAVKHLNWDRRWRYEREPWSAVTDIASAPKALFLCDSFTNGRMYKFLERSFSASVFKHHNGMQYDKRLISEQNPGVVVYIVAERLIPGSLTN